MTRWAMAADLVRCVGCQTCTAACKHANATSPAVQWRRVLDVESGVFPDVKRTFVPVGCMHCADPPCMHVCPSTATGQRADGIVTIDYDLCIGCAYCAVACPYQARYKVDRPRFAYGARQMRNEAAREDPRRLGVAQKCTFCKDRVDGGLARGLTPGVDPAATPACVNSCIADALHFGDLDDPEGKLSTLLRTRKHFRMHTELGTGPGFYYLYGRADGDDDADAVAATAAATAAPDPDDRPEEPPIDPGTLQKGVAPWLQRHWDWRAAGNFMCGGAGSGLAAFAAAAALAGASFTATGLAALVLVGAGLFLVWLEIGRPWRFLNVFFNPRTSWMTREAMAGVPLFATSFVAAVLDWPLLAAVAAAIGLVFLYCQARLVHASKGVPAWRARPVVPLLVVTGLAEGGGLFLAIALVRADLAAVRPAAACIVLLLLALRFWIWLGYRRRLAADGVPTSAQRALDAIRLPFVVGGHVLAVALLAAGLIGPTLVGPLLAAGGFFAFTGGWLFKFVLITGAGYNQGFAIVRTPVRGSGVDGVGIKPGWVRA